MRWQTLFFTAIGLLSVPSSAHAESISQKLEVIGGNLALFGVIGMFLVVTGAIPIQFYLGFMLILASVLIISSGLIWIVFAICGGILGLFLVFWLISSLSGKLNTNSGSGYSRPNLNSVSMPNLVIPKLSIGSQFSNCSREYGQVTKILWHGTPSVNRAMDILQGAGTWVVGSGNASGTGVYMASRGTAKGYAGSKGALVKLQMSIHSSQIVYSDDLWADQNFNTWKKANSRWGYGDAITEYATRYLGKRYLKVNNDIWVALAHKTQNSHLVKFGGITALGVYDLYGNQIA